MSAYHQVFFRVNEVIVEMFLPRVPLKGEIVTLIEDGKAPKRFCVIMVGTVVKIHPSDPTSVGFHIELGQS